MSKDLLNSFAQRVSFLKDVIFDDRKPTDLYIKVCGDSVLLVADSYCGSAELLAKLDEPTEAEVTYHTNLEWFSKLLFRKDSLHISKSGRFYFDCERLNLPEVDYKIKERGNVIAAFDVRSFYELFKNLVSLVDFYRDSNVVLFSSSDEIFVLLLINSEDENKDVFILPSGCKICDHFDTNLHICLSVNQMYLLHRFSKYFQFDKMSPSKVIYVCRNLSDVSIILSDTSFAITLPGVYKEVSDEASFYNEVFRSIFSNVNLGVNAKFKLSSRYVYDGLRTLGISNRATNACIVKFLNGFGEIQVYNSAGSVVPNGNVKRLFGLVKENKSAYVLASADPF